GPAPDGSEHTAWIGLRPGVEAGPALRHPPLAELAVVDVLPGRLQRFARELTRVQAPQRHVRRAVRRAWPELFEIKGSHRTPPTACRRGGSPDCSRAQVV